MGGYYAEAGGAPAAVASAIRDHYRPQGPADGLPATPEGLAVSLADKIDSLVGFFGVGAKPTGSKDPFALRRAALGVVRLLVENDIRIPLINAFREAEMLYGGSSDVSADLLGFIADRMKVTLKDRGLRHDWITAVFESGDSMDDDLVRVTKRVEALRDFVGTDSGADLLAGYRRAANILRAEAKKAKGKLSVGSIDASLFEEPAERALHAALSGSKCTDL